MASEHFDHSLIPKGWSADPKYLQDMLEEFPREDYDFETTDEITPILYDTGSCPDRLFSCPVGQYFLWNELSSHTLKILEPKKLDDIVPQIDDPSRKGLKYVHFESKPLTVTFGKPERVGGPEMMGPERIDPSQIPAGWFIDPVGPPQMANGLCREEYNIHPTAPVQSILSRHDHDVQHLVSCPPGTYFLWNDESGDLFEIIEPKKLDDIIPQLNSPDLSGLKLKDVEPQYTGPIKYTRTIRSL